MYFGTFWETLIFWLANLVDCRQIGHFLGSFHFLAQLKQKLKSQNQMRHGTMLVSILVLITCINNGGNCAPGYLRNFARFSSRTLYFIL